MSASIDRGRFVWYDLMTSTPEKAIPFYTAVAGWGTQPVEGMPYTMWTVGQTPVGGLTGITPEMAQAGVKPYWLPYIASPDTDATVTQATSLGGNVLTPPTDIPTIGRFAIMTDPQGATFAIFTPSEWTAPPDTDAGVGKMSWHELPTTNHEGAFAFYSALFGWEKTDAMDMGPDGTYQMYGRNGRTLGGMFNTSQVPPHWLLYINVPDADAAAERVKQLGGTVRNGPMDVPGGGRIAHCLDPQGAAFAVHSNAGAQ